MKKLVTIVSAVMMLLMLAACAPTIDYSAEDMEQIVLGKTALSTIQSYANDELAKVVEEANKDKNDDKVIPSTYVLTLEDEVTVGETHKIAAGTKVEVAVKDGLADWSACEVKGSVTWKVNADDTADTTVKIEYYCTETEKGPFIINGKGYDPHFVDYTVV